MGERLKDADLMRYFDGELSPAEMARVEEALRSNEDARKRLEALGEMRGLLREAVQARAADATQSCDVWAGVRRGIERAPSLAERAGAWWRSRWAMPAFGIAAAAAVVALVFASGGEPAPGPTAVVAPPAPAADAATSTPDRAPRAPGPLVEVEEIEAEGTMPAVVMTSAEPGENAIPVVWIEEK